MNEDQKTYYDYIITSIKTDIMHVYFFLLGLVDTSKTFIYQTFCHHFQSKKEIVLYIALSDIITLLLLGSHISHF